MFKKIINKNSLPFCILTLLHLYLIIRLLKQKKHKSVWLLLLSNIGFAYVFEYPVLNLFYAYRYRPSIFKNRYVDGILGAILSQAIYVPISATFLTLNNMKWRWKCSFSLIYFLIENLFIRLKVYRVYWWKPIYTLILLNLYFYISDFFHKALTNKRKWALSIAHYLSINVITISLMYVSALLRHFRFGTGIHHTWKEHFVIAPIYSSVFSYIAMKNASKPGIFNRFSMLIYTVAMEISLNSLGILKLNFKRMLETTPFYIFMIFISRYLYLIIYQKQQAT
ncbi:hypothetical protein QA612_18075 [Evansella sp. AB-P1]|uniref:hypothetical protein n=1 Tax=Evansella sp. AB-P1 TaxID=3037653 RepID=UPI00241C39F5|nr:hypothetical protein [Evansella sp. AB-P1]MDG5789372.1 hypothetical protein [Evansella sp. AB-P1]